MEVSDRQATHATLLTWLENQVNRTRCALIDLDHGVYIHDPGGDCNSIREIGKHLIMLRGFQLLLLGSDLRSEMPDDQVESVEALIKKLDVATDLVRRAIEAHDPDDWHAEPTGPREGPWADLPTLVRFIRPMNDFTNHLGSIRAIRRIMGHPAGQTQ